MCDALASTSGVTAQTSCDPNYTQKVITTSALIKGRTTSTEMAKLVKNFEIVMRCSNATPLRALHGLSYTCYFCDEQFPGPGELKNHTLKSHQDFRHTSSTRLPSLSNYSVKLDITLLTCSVCCQRFNQLSPFMDHLRLKHNQPIHTDVKNYMLPFKFDSDPLKCALCDTEFNTFRNIVEHMNTHFRNFICDVCGTGFINRASWRTHKANHDYGDYPCSKCPQVFSSVVKLRNHNRYLHLGMAKRNKCAYCSEKFTCLIIKNNHMVREHGVAPTVVQCKACDKTFRNYTNLRIHQKRSHLLEVKRVKCTQCDMTFRDGNKLKEHMVKHTQARNFVCLICEKAYGRRQTLREHLRIHANDRRYRCDYCNMGFVQKCRLKSHILAKHGKDFFSI